MNLLYSISAPSSPCFDSCLPTLLPSNPRIDLWVQIITQLDHVYAIVYPPAYAKVVKVLNVVFHVFFGWLPVHQPVLRG